MAHENFKEDRGYSRAQISKRLGGSRIAFAPTDENRVTCLCIDPDRNPKAPEVVFLGTGPRIERMGELIAEQKGPFPTFLKEKASFWRYLGRYRFTRLSRTASRIEREYVPAQTPKEDVTAILYFESA